MPCNPPESGEAVEVPPWRPGRGPRPDVLVYPHGREPLLWIYTHGAWCYAVVRARFRTPGSTAYQVHIHPPGTLHVYIRTYRWHSDSMRVIQGPKPPHDRPSQTRLPRTRPPCLPNDHRRGRLLTAPHVRPHTPKGPTTRWSGPFASPEATMAGLMLGATRWAEIMPDVTKEMIWHWKNRGLITPDGLDEHNRPVYLQLTIARAEAATAPGAGRT